MGEQKRLEQTDRRKGRISILGLWQPEQSFKYALACGSFKSESYIKVVDWIAEFASRTLKDTGRMTVVVQDNGSLHKSHLTRQQWQRVIPFFAFPSEIRKAIYTTNAIESVNMTLRKVLKNHRTFPTDESALKVVYLALQNISKKWTMPIKDWKAALNRFGSPTKIDFLPNFHA